MFSNLEEKIKTAKLTKTESAVAEYIINNLNTVCFMTATDIAREARVSDSSVIRFCRALGFSGYQHLQKTIQQEMMQQIEDGGDTILSPLEKLGAIVPGLRESDLVSAHLDYSIANIKSVIEKNNPEKFDAVASILIHSRQKYIAGFRGCRGMADWMALILNHMLPNVRRSTGAGSDAVEQLLDLGEEDCVLLISFHRYANAAIETVNFARTRKAKVIVLTDKLTAPVASGADQVIILNVQGLSFFNSLTAVAFTIELIMGAVSKAIGTGHQDLLAVIDSYVSRYGFY